MADVEQVLREIFARSAGEDEDGEETGDARQVSLPLKDEGEKEGSSDGAGTAEQEEGKAQELVNLIADAVAERLQAKVETQQKIAEEVRAKAEELIPARLKADVEVQEMIDTLLGSLDANSLRELSKDPSPLVAIAIGQVALQRTRAKEGGVRGVEPASPPEREVPPQVPSTPAPEVPRAKASGERLAPRTPAEKEVINFYRAKGFSDEEIKNILTEFGLR